MAVRPVVREDHDLEIKLLLIGDTGVGKSCLLLRFTDYYFTSGSISTTGIDFKYRTIELGGKRIRLRVWDTAGQERFRTITRAYFRVAMGIILVYDITNEASFNNIHKWIQNIKQHASENVNMVLVGNKADVDEREISTAQGQALAEQHNLRFFETSAKTSLNVENCFFAIAQDIKQRLEESDSPPEPPVGKIHIVRPDPTNVSASASKKSACCFF